MNRQWKKVSKRPGTWTVSSVAGSGVHRIDFNGWSRGIARISFSSDWHFDSTHCDRVALKAMLDSALANNTPVCVIGDLFDSMQGRGDKRSSKSEMRPEYVGGENYFDAIIEDAAKFLAPYLSVIAIICPGNHETSVSKNQETNLTVRLVERLRSAGSNARVGGYSGWIRVGVRGVTYRVFYHHGSGGGSAASKGTLEFARIADYVDGADALVCGHIHQRGIYEARRVSMTAQGKLLCRQFWQVRLGAFKDEYHNGAGGWHVERGMGPRACGGWTLELKPAEKTGPLIANWTEGIVSNGK